MTIDQISVILDDLGYDLNQEISLKEVSSIALNNDSCLYPCKEDTRIKFLSTNGSNLLLVYKGVGLQDGTFKKRSTLPQYAISIDLIEGFRMVSPAHPSEPFRTGRAA